MSEQPKERMRKRKREKKKREKRERERERESIGIRSYAERDITPQRQTK